MNTVMREEKKFLVNTEEFVKKHYFLNQVMLPDLHNGQYGYLVRSLYFDTVNDNDFFEKIDGVELRRKIRLRCYSPDSDFAMLEMKQKQGPYQLKRSLIMTREDAQKLIDGKFDILLKYPEDFAKECYAVINTRCYRPKAVVDYKRTAFIAKENKIRITFDRDITSTQSSFDIFSKNLLLNPVFDRFNTILEVKFNGFLLSYIRDFINSIEKSELSVSKYILGRRQGYAEY